MSTNRPGSHSAAPAWTATAENRDAGTTEAVLSLQETPAAEAEAHDDVHAHIAMSAMSLAARCAERN
ncbi:hypothetical protein [Streptacidiphilus anmyonensis]|uniref:hypothetical protein n=1 Tax=Streptacidiphilus anmyonensis TaxID=405782 RepID=UPI0005AA80AE|nr:hypothetical protein [Streptacidiphilus anmyonensis]